MKLKCNNQRCLYEWNYNGKNPFYATCPRCLLKVRVKTKGELDAEPQIESSADASNKAPDNNVLGGAIDSTKDEKKGEIMAENESDNGFKKGLKSKNNGGGEP